MADVQWQQQPQAGCEPVRSFYFCSVGWRHKEGGRLKSNGALPFSMLVQKLQKILKVLLHNHIRNPNTGF